MGCGGETSFISIFEYSNKLEIGDGGVWGSKKNNALFVVHGTVPVPGTYPMPPHPELFMPGSLSGAIIGGGRRLLILREEIPKLLEPGQLGSVLNGG